MLGIVSVLIGVVMGFLSCLMFKHMRFLTHSVVTETFLMTALGFSAYFIAEITTIIGTTMSGIIALLVFSIIQAHYTWYNLSPQGKTTTSVTYEFLGKAAEALVYSYVGISLYTSIPGYWSWSIIWFLTLVIIVGRVFGVICTFYTFRLCCRKKTISFNELMFIVWGGMIRGAIAFALVLKIPYAQYCTVDNANCYADDLYQCARSTCLVVVFITTLVFGTFMKQAQYALLGRPEVAEHEGDAKDRAKSHYEEIAHPNFEE